MDRDGDGDQGGELLPAAEGHPHRHPLGEGVDGHHGDDEEHPPRPRPAHAPELHVLAVQVLVPDLDEQHPDRRPGEGLGGAVGRPLDDEPEARPEHEAGGDGLGVGDDFFRNIPDEEKRKRAQPGRQGGDRSVDEDESDFPVHETPAVRRRRS